MHIPLILAPISVHTLLVVNLWAKVKRNYGKSLMKKKHDEGSQLCNCKHQKQAGLLFI